MIVILLVLSSIDLVGAESDDVSKIIFKEGQFN
ncbi:uncharacterized protein METZ01_LOCUS245577, partial [marine metagenome]